MKMERNLDKILFKEENGLLGFFIRNSINTDICLKVLEFIEKKYSAQVTVSESSSDVSLKLKIIIDEKSMSYFHDDMMDDALYAETKDANYLVKRIGNDLEEFLQTFN